MGPVARLHGSRNVSQEEDFRVEREAVDAGRSEESLRDGCFEEFEAALRVFELER